MLQKTPPKAPCLIAKRMPHTTLTIVCTINVSIDCECFDVSNPSERENIHKKIKAMGCLVCVLFLKIIVCKDDEIPAFSSTTKMGLNCLQLTN